MKKIFDAVATIGKYKDRQTGEEKKRYVNVGSVFQDDQGRMALKLDVIPTTHEWSGWLAFYEPKDQPQRHQQARPTQQRQAPAADDDGGDDIPF